MAEAKFYVYVHRRADSGEVFYVGKGKGSRANCVKRRGAHWDRVVAKHGLTIEILEHFEIESDAFARECALIASYRAAGVELVNQTDGGDGASGAVRSDETLRRMSEAGKGKRLGQKRSDETRAKMRSSAIGRRMSPEAVAKTAASRVGKKLPAETVQKIKESLKGRRTRGPLSREALDRIAVANTGRKHSDEAREKMSARAKGGKKRPQSPEHREKIAEARRRYWVEWRAAKAATNSQTE